MKNIISTVIATVTLGLFTTAVQAGSSEKSLVKEAHRVIDYSDDLKREVVRHFRHTDEYRHLISDAAKIRTEARHLDGLAHHVHSQRDVNHIKADLKDLDKLVHHVSAMIREIDHGHGRGGHTHGDTRQAVRLVDSMNRSIHSMERTVRDLDRRFSYSSNSHSSKSHSSKSRSTGKRIAKNVVREVRRHR